LVWIYVFKEPLFQDDTMSRYNTDSSEEPIWIKVVGDFPTVKDLQKVIDRLDVDFGDDSRLIAKNTKKRGLHIIKDPEEFQDYEVESVRDLLIGFPEVDEVMFSFEMIESESFGSF